MHKVHLSYRLAAEAPDGEPLVHPLFSLLAAIHEDGSIAGAARRLGLSYRHVWGELKRWEAELGQALVHWVKGQPALLTAFGEKLLWAERRAQARLAPQIEALRGELERAFAVAFDDSAWVLTLYASHDMALPALRDLAARTRNLHLDVQFTGSVDALAALNAGRCQVAGFHALTDTPLRSPTARVFRPLLRPGLHKLLGFARRTQGLIVPAGNPRGIASLAELTRGGVRFANRAMGAGTRVLLDELLSRAGIDSSVDRRLCERRAVARSRGRGRGERPGRCRVRRRAGRATARARLHRAGRGALFPGLPEERARAAAAACAARGAGQRRMARRTRHAARLRAGRCRRGAAADAGVAVVEVPQPQASKDLSGTAALHASSADGLLPASSSLRDITWSSGALTDSTQTSRPLA